MLGKWDRGGRMVTTVGTMIEHEMDSRDMDLVRLIEREGFGFVEHNETGKYYV